MLSDHRNELGHSKPKVEILIAWVSSSLIVWTSAAHKMQLVIMSGSFQKRWFPRPGSHIAQSQGAGLTPCWGCMSVPERNRESRCAKCGRWQSMALTVVLGFGVFRHQFPHRIHHALSCRFQLVLAIVYLDLGTYWCWCWEYSSQSSRHPKSLLPVTREHMYAHCGVEKMSVPISMTLCFPGSQALCSQSLSLTFPVSIFFLFTLHPLPASLNTLLHCPVCDGISVLIQYPTHHHVHMLCPTSPLNRRQISMLSKSHTLLPMATLPVTLIFEGKNNWVFA